MKDKGYYSEELRKLNAFNDPSGLTLDQIQKKLQVEDPSMFRQVMKDLNYGGEEPVWEKMEMFDRVAEPGESSEKVVKQELDRLKKEKGELASELQRT